MNVDQQTAPLTVKLLWFAIVLVALADYVFVYRSFDGAIETTIASMMNVETALRRNETILRERGVLERRRHELATSLRAYVLTSDRSTTVARFLSDAARLAHDHQVDIRSVDAGHDSAVSTPATTRRADVAFDGIPLDLHLRGEYGQILNVIRGLARGRVVARIELRSIEKTPGPSHGRSALDAWLSATVERLPEGPPTAGAP